VVGASRRHRRSAAPAALAQLLELALDAHCGRSLSAAAVPSQLNTARFEATLQPAKAHRHSDAANGVDSTRMFETGSRRAFSEGL
jgi:hypothetical protein